MNPTEYPDKSKHIAAAHLTTVTRFNGRLLCLAGALLVVQLLVWFMCLWNFWLLSAEAGSVRESIMADAAALGAMRESETVRAWVSDRPPLTSRLDHVHIWLLLLGLVIGIGNMALAAVALVRKPTARDRLV